LFDSLGLLHEVIEREIKDVVDNQMVGVMWQIKQGNQCSSGLEELKNRVQGIKQVYGSIL